jgi:ribosomal-protein-alanine N-acetyltransferase
VDTAYTLRPAGPEDIEALVAIDAVNPSPWSERQFAGTVGAKPGCGKTVMVVHREGPPDGFIVYSQVLDEASIHNVAVCAARRGRGLGGLLLAGSLQRMRSAGATRCLLEVRRSNVAARRLYETAGFALDGERKDYYPGNGEREGALLMSRSL